MNKVAIIPARGGSKRIPRKNIKSFLGKPIIAYSIESAISSGLFDEVMVSTDDLEIASIAKSYGASIPFIRSDRTSNDFANTFDVVDEVLQEYNLISLKFDFTCCIYPCAPFITKDKLINSFQLLIENNFDSVFPIMPFGFPIQRALKQDQSKISFLYPDYSLKRSQELEKSFHDAGQFYWMNTDVCLKKKQIITNNSGGFFISELEGQDIDNDVDWKLAELKYITLQNNN